MRYRINDTEIILDKSETAAARRMVANFMDKLEQKSAETGNTSLFFTALILMQVMSQEALDELDPETLQKYMAACERIRKDPPD